MNQRATDQYLSYLRNENARLRLWLMVQQNDRNAQFEIQRLERENAELRMKLQPMARRSQ